MSAVACRSCALRFARPAPTHCPQCERAVVALASSAALGLRLYAPVDISLPSLAAAIAARPQKPPLPSA
jgi:hypothetical protein